LVLLGLLVAAAMSSASSADERAGGGGGGISGDMGPDGATARAHSCREEMDVLLVELDVSAVATTWCSAGGLPSKAAAAADAKAVPCVDADDDVPPAALPPRGLLSRAARIPTILPTR
jgi:hypothetical protein